MANSNPASPILFGRNFPSSTTSDTKPSKTDKRAWKLMVIDDEESVHQVTRMVLEDLTYEGRSLAILNGYSGEDARRLMSEHPDTAVLLLDVVMETDNAGLDVVEKGYHNFGGEPGGTAREIARSLYYALTALWPPGRSNLYVTAAPRTEGTK